MTSPQTANDERLKHADAALRRCNELIAEEAKEERTRTRASTSSRIRKILNNVDQVAMVLEGLAELHPIAKGAVKQFRTLVRLELDRQSNNEQIVAVCHTMATMLHTIHLITDDLDSDQNRGLKGQVEHEMKRATQAMCDFGVFADMYYVKLSARVVRYLRVAQFRKELLGYSETFSEHRRTLTELLTARIHSQGIKAGQNISSVLENTKKILEMMTAGDSKAELEAAKIVEEYGGEEQSMRNPDAVRRIADVLESEPGAHKEPVTQTTLHLLNGNMSDLYAENRSRFEVKLNSAKMELRESLDRSAELIIDKLDKGPHTLIEDPEVRQLWKSSNWKMSAKSRSFMHELLIHYTATFNRARLNGEPVHDQWTLKVFDVSYHAAIAEAVDEDATGYLSVHELNHFTKRKPPHFSTPVWFAFWAVGCRYLNATLTSSIEHNLSEIERECDQLRNDSPNKDFIVGIEEYQKTCGLLRYVVSWCQLVETTEDNILDDLDDDTSIQVREWAHQYRDYLAKGFNKRLEPLNYCIDDGALLPVIIDTADDRIEQTFFSLVNVITQNQGSIIREFYNSRDRRPKKVDQFIQKMSEMDTTVFTLLSELHARMKTLMRLWRAQKLDVELELECYNGGILYGWYTAYQEPECCIAEKFDGYNPGPRRIKRTTRTISAISSRIDALSEQLTKLDERLTASSAVLEQRLTPSVRDKRDVLLVVVAALLVFKFC